MSNLNVELSWHAHQRLPGVLFIRFSNGSFRKGFALPAKAKHLEI
jgi:hypothetical protein